MVVNKCDPGIQNLVNRLKWGNDADFGICPDKAPKQSVIKNDLHSNIKWSILRTIFQERLCDVLLR